MRCYECGDLSQWYWEAPERIGIVKYFYYCHDCKATLELLGSDAKFRRIQLCRHFWTDYQN